MYQPSLPKVHKQKIIFFAATFTWSSVDPEGGHEVRTPPPPPQKSQVIWVSIGNKTWKKLDPPPVKCWTPSGTLKMIDFFEIDHLTSEK